MSYVRTCSLMLVVLFLAGVLLLSGVHAVVSKIQAWGQDRAQVEVSENVRETARYQAQSAAETTKQVEIVQSYETVRFLAHEVAETDRLRIVTDAQVTMHLDDNQTTRDTSLVWLGHKLAAWGLRVLVILATIAGFLWGVVLMKNK